MKKQSVESNFINWKHFARTYLLSAKISVLKKIEVENKVPTINKDAEWRFESGLIFIPIIYSIRHAIELFLKSLDVKSNQEIIKSHDTDILVGALEAIDINDTRKKKKVLKLVTKYAKYDFSPPVFDNSRNDLDNEFFRYPHIANKNKIIGENLKLIKSYEILKDIEILESVIDVDSHASN